LMHERLECFLAKFPKPLLESNHVADSLTPRSSFNGHSRSTRFLPVSRLVASFLGACRLLGSLLDCWPIRFRERAERGLRRVRYFSGWGARWRRPLQPVVEFETAGEHPSADKNLSVNCGFCSAAPQSGCRKGLQTYTHRLWRLGSR
jgi:hypothetical protein